MGKKHIERDDLLIGVEVFSLCKNRSRTLIEITEGIYGNNMYKNVTRVYRCLEVFMKHGLVVPVFKDRVLSFKLNGDNNKVN